MSVIFPLQQTWKRLASRRLVRYECEHEGARRAALLYVPQHVKRRRGLPLVLVFHGGASSPESVARASGMHRLAEQEGFIVAYPFGTPGKSGLTWVPSGRSAARLVGDTRFARTLIEALEHDFIIDPQRIYIAGISIGGSLAYELASVMAKKIAAFAVVSGTMTAAHPEPIRPVPLIHIHGKKDRRVPFEGGRGPSTSGVKQWVPVQACIEYWRRINNCPDAPVASRSAESGAVSYRYKGDADIELWVLEDGFHSWPGGRRKKPSTQQEHPAPEGFSATKAIWAFFKSHPLSDASSRR